MFPPAKRSGEGKLKFELRTPDNLEIALLNLSDVPKFRHFKGLLSVLILAPTVCLNFSAAGAPSTFKSNALRELTTPNSYFKIHFY